MSLTPKQRLIVALDFPTQGEALSFVKKMGATVEFYKVGLELFSAAGPEIVTRLKSEGKLVFLDLKYHDIPNTVAGACARAVEMGADMFNVHATGGVSMMRAAIESASETAAKLGVKTPILLAVTVLTSLDKGALEREVGLAIEQGVSTFVTEKAKLAKHAGLGGVVASPKEASEIRTACGDDFHIVTPGIRPAWASTDDQRRIMTPSDAIALGADRIVVGRPITRADNPVEAAERILDEIQ